MRVCATNRMKYLAIYLKAWGFEFLKLKSERNNKQSIKQKNKISLHWTRNQILEELKSENLKIVS